MTGPQHHAEAFGDPRTSGPTQGAGTRVGIAAPGPGLAEALLQASRDAVLGVDATGRITFANERAAAGFGVPLGALVGEPLSRWVPLSHEALDTAAERGTDERLQARRADGTAFTAEVRVVRVGVADGPPHRVVMVRDLTDRLAAEERLRAEARLAEAANASKSQFLATMSHEIRTPLNAILGYAELLETGVAGELSSTQEAYVRRVRASGTHLLSLVNDILDLSRLEAGRLLVARDRASAAEVIETALALVQPQATARGVTLRTSSDAGEVAFMGDARRVSQIIVNLLSNAVKFTPAGNAVEVEARLRDATEEVSAGVPGPGCWCAITVRDEGIGIDAERHEAVFEAFVQVGAEGEGPSRGTGLGLTISRRLARLMGGDVTVRSVPGSGSSFTVWLPAPPRIFREGEASIGPCAIADRRGATRRARGLIGIGNAILRNLDAIVREHVEALRADPHVPHDEPTSAVEAHTVTFLSDIAQSLAIIEESEGAPSGLLRDASDIRRAIAVRHGARRFEQGWTEDSLEREFALLEREVERTVRTAVADEPDVALEDGIAVLRRFVRQARETSRLGFRQAQAGETARPGDGA